MPPRWCICTGFRTVDLAADHRRAFDEDPGVPVGLAVSADGDDTGATIEAMIEDLRLE